MILHLLMENPYYRDTKLAEVMGKPFPYVGLNHTAAEISKLISKENSAVLVKTNMGETTIITEFDLIEAMA
jgi:cystathionine beta-synthase